MDDSAGLGLTIVRTFVEGELGGSIDLRPVSGASGTVAEVRVPAEVLVGAWEEAQEPVAG